MTFILNKFKIIFYSFLNIKNTLIEQNYYIELYYYYYY